MISTYGGLVNYLPKYSFLFLIFALAALGLPGTTGFLGEFLVLSGSFKKNYIVAMLATIGVVLGAAYILWLTKRVIFGKIKNEQIKNLKDTNKLELVTEFPLFLHIEHKQTCNYKCPHCIIGNPDEVEKLYNKAENYKKNIIIAKSNEKIHPIVGIWNVSLLQKLEEYLRQ